MRPVQPIAFLATLLALLAGLGMAAPAAANTTNVTAVAAGTNAFTVIATYTNSPAGVPATLTANGSGVFTAAAASGAGGVMVSGFTAGAKTITTTADTSGATTDVITITGTVTCQAAGQMTFVLTQGGGSPATSSSQPMSCFGGIGTTATTGGLTVSPTSAAPGQQVMVSGNCTAGATLTVNPPAGQFVAATINGQPAQPQAGGIACTTTGTLVATFICSQQTQVTFGLSGQSGTLGCGVAGATTQFPYGQQGYPYGQQPYGQQPYGQSYPGVNQPINNTFPNASNANSGGSPLSIQVSPSNVSCGSTASVSISARGPDGQPVNQGNVNLYTTTGAIEPKNGTISNGRFDTKFTAPSTGGTATISASVMGMSNSVDVKVDCAGGVAQPSTSSPAPATTSSVLNAPASPPPPPVTAPIISPPSTGDAGLKALPGD